MTPDQEQTLNDSIKELAEGDYSSSCSGYRQVLYLDPEGCVVYVFGHVGEGVPMAAWHGRHARICDIPCDAIPGSVSNALLMVEDRIAALCDAYLGSEWDGSNHVGKWNEDEDTDIFDIGETPEIVCYWDPGEWFSGDGTYDVIAERLRAGETPDQIVAGLWLGDESTGEVREADAREWVEGVASEIAD